jgi:hypothetical protein
MRHGHGGWWRRRQRRKCENDTHAACVDAMVEERESAILAIISTKSRFQLSLNITFVLRS